MAALDPSARSALLELGEPRRLEKDEALIREGDRQSDRVYLLRSTRPGNCACAKVTANVGNGVEALLGIRVTGDLVGEMGVIRRAARSATVTMCSPALAFGIEGTAFLALLEKYPRAAATVAGMIADRLQWANQRRLDFAGFDVPVRLGRVIDALADRHGVDVTDGVDLGVSLSQQELGRLVGAREAAVGKAIRMFRERGVLRTRYRRMIIADREALRALIRDLASSDCGVESNPDHR
ncbi:Crp/Fnr family transcriptional regulator [Nonomuraea sp. NPDC046802]|uniref:Crp/Fnr family transcriptional regulator n=1 Tax=Nonomuraea sp. NPDC046802 TaxID=3154919 RepID=UPI0033CDE4A2